MQPKGRDIHVLDVLGYVEQAENVFDFLDMLRINTRRVALFEQQLEVLCVETSRSLPLFMARM